MNVAKRTLQCVRIFAVVLLAVVVSLAQLTGNLPSAGDRTQATPNPVPPPAAPPQRSAADLEKLVAPIALYPDSLVATILPASVYPLEIVQAARFVADANNVAKIDEQPWDDNVKAVARVPDAIKKLNDDLPWTIQLGEAFLAQDKDVMDAIQRLRLKTQKNGMLKTSEQMVVVVSNTVVQTTVEQQVVVVTNTIVQIQSANPQVIYVPQYNPVYVYAPPPTYVASPVDPFLTFAAGVAVGAIIANNCDWHHGGCYYGGGNSYNRNITINGDVNINTGNIGSGNRATTTSGQGQKWKPDQNRLNKSGATSGTSARSQEARGYGSGGARPSTGTAGARPSSGTVGARSSVGSAGGAGPSAGAGGARPSTGAAPSGNRPSPSQGSVSKPTPSAGGGGNVFSGAGSGASDRSASSRGSASRSSGGGSGASRGGGRGGGGRR